MVRIRGGGGGGGVSDHSLLTNLDYASAAHTGFATEWGFADRWGQTKTFYLPFAQNNCTAEATNPILEKTGSGDEEVGVQYPSVVYRDGVYCMAYGAYDAAGAIRIYGCTSLDGISWSNRTKLIDLGASGTWDDFKVTCPKLFYDELETDPLGVWAIMYAGYSDATTHSIGFAFAADFLGPWTKSLSNPLTKPTGYNGLSIAACRCGNIYVGGYYNTGNGISVATSPDFTTWTYRNTILGLGGGGTFDSNALSHISLTYILGNFYCCYSGFDSVNYRLGIAFNSHPFGTFTKLPTNPLVGLGGAGSWNETHTFLPTLLQVEDTFKIYAGGQDASLVNSMGLFTIP